MIEDASAVKPDDWDENQPREVPDENAGIVSTRIYIY
jgi:hypothetical protein